MKTRVVITCTLKAFDLRSQCLRGRQLPSADRHMVRLDQQYYLKSRQAGKVAFKVDEIVTMASTHEQSA